MCGKAVKLAASTDDLLNRYHWMCLMTLHIHARVKHCTTELDDHKCSATPVASGTWDALFVHCRFEEDIALQQRMSAIGNIIQEHRHPHFLCFQVNAA